MATKIRLQRHGRKSYAFYSIVIADVRAPRDGKFTEKIGTYNPNTNPATVDLKFDRALYWVECGAQPTDTVRNILSGEGVYLMKHLRGGVKKGAFDEATCEAKFAAWKADKQKGLNQVTAKNEAEKKAAPTVTQEVVKAIMANSTFDVETMFHKCTVVACKLPNGFVIVETSACVSPENYDEKIGVEICMKKIENKIWELEGYRLQSEIYNASEAACDCDNCNECCDDEYYDCSEDDVDCDECDD